MLGTNAIGHVAIAGLTGPVENVAPFKPPAGWQFSPSRQQYRDPNGAIYDISGKPVKK